MNKESINFKFIMDKKLEQIRIHDNNKKEILNKINDNNWNINENNEIIFYNKYFINLINKIEDKNLIFINNINDNIVNKISEKIYLNKNNTQSINKIIVNEKKNIMNETYSLNFNINLKEELKTIDYYEKKIKNIKNTEYKNQRKIDEKILKEKIEKRRQIEREKKDKEEQIKKENLEKKKKELEEKEWAKHQKLLKIMENYEEKKKQRNEQVNESNKKFKEIKNKKPLYLKKIEEMETQYKKDNEKALIDFKNKTKKIDYKELLNHQNEIDKVITYKRGYNIRNMSTVDKTSKSSVNNRKIDDKDYLEVKNKLNKRIEYSKKVLKDYKPIHFRKNVKEEDNEKDKKDKYWKDIKEKIEENREKAKKFLLESTKKNKLRFNNKNTKIESLDKEISVKPNYTNFPDINGKNSFKKQKYKDYLKEMKEKFSKNRKINNLDKILKKNNDDLNENDFQLMMIEINKLENIAQNNKNFNKFCKKGNIEESDDLYINAIKAKLKIIEKCKNNINFDNLIFEEKSTNKTSNDKDNFSNDFNDNE